MTTSILTGWSPSSRTMAIKPIGLTILVAAVAIASVQGQSADPARGAGSGSIPSSGPASPGGVHALDFTIGSGSCGGNSDQNIGWQFDVLNPVTVSCMSWFDDQQDGLERSHEVAIWDPAGNLITSTQVTIPAGTAATLDGIWRTVPIAPTLLPAGVGYIVGGYNGAHGECLNFNVQQVVHPDLNYFDATYSAFTSVLERPTSFSSATNGFYGVGFQIGPGGPGTAYCPGDGIPPHTPCPCVNDNDGSVPDSGCANGVFASGAKLIGSGDAILSADTLVLSCTGLEPSNAGLYFQADNDLSPGSVWGDGLRCAGGGLKRLGVRFSDATGASDTSGLPQTISAKAGNISAGVTKYYQCWYRTTVDPPCGIGVFDFNTSNGYAITWAP